MQIDVDGAIFDVPDDASIEEIDAITKPPSTGDGYKGRPVGERVGRGNQPTGLRLAREHLRSTVEQNITGPLEAVATGASRTLVGGLGGGVASLAARVTGHDPAAARAAAEPFVVQPRTPTGKAIVADVNDTLGKVFEPVGEGIVAADEAIGEHAGPEAQNFARMVAGTASDIADVTPLAPAVSRGLRLAREAKVPIKQTADTLIEKARAGGLRVRPSDTDAIEFAGEKGSAGGRVGEWLGGSADLKKDFIIHNKPVFNSIIAEDIGLPKGSPMGPNELASRAAPQLKVYSDLRTRLQPVPMDDEVRSTIMNVDRNSESLLPMPPKLAALQAEIASNGTVTPGNLIDTISDLRRQGFKGAASEDPDIADMGLARVALANALEKQLDAMVARQIPDMVGKYQGARQELAKIHTLEATNVAGEVDPAALKRLNKKTERRVLTGGQLYIADMAEAFPDVVTRNMPEPKPPPTAGAVLANSVLLGTLPAGRAGVRGLLRSTRGESAVPQTGLKRALAEYYKGDIDEGRGALKLESPAGTVGEGRPQGTLNFDQPTDFEAATAPFEGVRPLPGPDRSPPTRALPLSAAGASRIPGSTVAPLEGPWPGNPGAWVDPSPVPGLSRAVGKQAPVATEVTRVADELAPKGATATDGAAGSSNDRTAGLVRAMAANSNIPPAQRWAAAKSLEKQIDAYQANRANATVPELRSLASALRNATGDEGSWYNKSEIDAAIKNLKTREVQAEAKRLSGNLGLRKSK